MSTSEVNTRRVGPLKIGTRPYMHWMLHLPTGIRLMRTPVATTLYRVGSDGNRLVALPFTKRCARTWRRDV